MFDSVILTHAVIIEPMLVFAAVLVALFLAGCSQPPPPPPQKESKPAFPLKITQYYADTLVARGGQKVNICYGVEGAKTVTLDPPVERLWPAPVRCFEVFPKSETTYTITAADEAGKTVSQKLTVRTGPPEAKILEVSVPSLEIRAGEPFQFCVSAVNVRSWRLSGGQWKTTPSEKGGCAGDSPRKTTTYVITAVGAMGETDIERVTVTVK